MTTRPERISRSVVRFNEVVQFDDKDRGCLGEGEMQQIRMPLSAMEQCRWLPTSPPESPKTNYARKLMTHDTKRKLMKDLGLSCPPMPPRLPTRRPSNQNDLDKLSSEKFPATTRVSFKKPTSPIRRRQNYRIKYRS